MADVGKIPLFVRFPVLSGITLFIHLTKIAILRRLSTAGKTVAVEDKIVEREHIGVIGGPKEPLILVVEADDAMHGRKVEHPAGAPPSQKIGRNLPVCCGEPRSCEIILGNKNSRGCYAFNAPEFVFLLRVGHQPLSKKPARFLGVKSKLGILDATLQNPLVSFQCH